MPESRELDLKDVKKVLNDLSINFGYDLEPSKEFILLQHVNMTYIILDLGASLIQFSKAIYSNG
jgi:hypothetical protein